MMKKLSILISILISIFAFGNIVRANEVECPFGRINDPAPGACARYIDANDNDLCDLSEVSSGQNIVVEGGTVNSILEKEFKQQTATLEAVEKRSRYKMGIIILILTILYIVSSLMVRLKKISLFTQRRIWNVLLLFSFLATLVLAILLIIKINWGWSPKLPFNILYWHVETGTIMAVITVFHLMWHWQYYACMLKRKKGENCEK